MTPTETVRAIAAHLPAGEEYAAAARAAMRLIVNRIATARGLEQPWDADLPADTAAHVAEHVDSIDGLEAWGAPELGPAYELLMNPDARKIGGSYYTPPEVADFMNRFAVGLQLDLVADASDPDSLLAVTPIDPSCGAGVFLVSAARLIATRYAAAIAARVGIAEVTDDMVDHVLPDVMDSCIFGVDLDPVAVDLAKSALWLEIDGRAPITFMDRNVICGNSLEDEMPPKFEEIHGPSPRRALDREAS